jgi:hypothetical protein
VIPSLIPLFVGFEDAVIDREMSDPADDLVSPEHAGCCPTFPPALHD